MRTGPVRSRTNSGASPSEMEVVAALGADLGHCVVYVSYSYLLTMTWLDLRRASLREHILPDVNLQATASAPDPFLAWGVVEGGGDLTYQALAF